MKHRNQLGAGSVFALRAIPQGYDARCEHCGEPYTFSNARAVQTLNSERFCSPRCERLTPSGSAGATTDGGAAPQKDQS